ncbi:Trypanosome variant surface glycoprotein (A-type), putative [Trypanosoma equiperdum]|uniref:Trypanosome variant surface glycoprotein (A-type), putative n=1 Tax=Trypanosoma equiperdum TaxID=5694 RepID=A0A1G4HY35_TRYEQ|nr:Trypanosome variant surface glycoprotein (A-type), putative [Trypanosoma equiperdum]
MDIRTITLLEVISALSFVVTTWTDAAESNAVGHAATTKLCALIKHNKKAAESTTARQKQLIAEMGRLRTLSLKAEAAACAAAKDDTAALTLFADYVQAKLRQASVRLENLAPKASAAAAALGYTAGRLDETISVFNQAVSSNTGTEYCLQARSGGTGAHKLTSVDAACTALLQEDPAAGAAHGKYNYAAHTAMLHNAGGISDGTSSTCQLTKIGSSGGYEATTGVTTQVYWGAGALKIDGSGPNVEPLAAAAAEGSAPNIEAHQKARQAYDKFHAAAAAQTTPTENNYDNWKGDDTLLQVIAETLAAQTNKAKIEKGDTAVTAARDKFLGDGQAQFTAKVWDKLQKTKLTYSDGTTLKRELAEEISSDENFADAAFRCLQAKRKEALKPKIQQQHCQNDNEAHKPEEVCNAIGDANETRCKKNSRMSFRCFEG